MWVNCSRENRATAHLVTISTWMVFALLSMAVAGSCRDSGRQAREVQVQVAAEPSPSFFRSRASWQKLIESVDHEFERRKSALQYSLEQFDGDCEIHLTRRQGGPDFRLSFFRDGVETGPLPWPGYAVFLARGSQLFYAGAFGSFAAYDLTNATGRWWSQPDCFHYLSGPRSSWYLVNMHLQNGRVVVVWRDIDDHVKIVDQATGRCMAQREIRDRKDEKIMILPSGYEPDIREFGEHDIALPKALAFGDLPASGTGSAGSGLGPLSTLVGATQTQDVDPFAPNFVRPNPPPRPKPIDWGVIRKEDPKKYWE